MKNKIFLTLAFVLAFFLLAGLVNAFGVGSPYWKDRPLNMYPGETKTIDLNLQNNVGDNDVTVNVRVIQGEDIASLAKDTYVVKAKTIDVLVPLKITIPKDATEPYYVKVEIRTVSSGEGGTVVMGTGMKIGFDVLITEIPEEVKQREKIRNLVMSAVGIIVVLAIIFFIIYYLLRKKPKIASKPRKRKKRR